MACAQRFGAAAAVVAVEDVGDRAVVVDLVAHGLADRVLEVVLRAACGEVEEGLGEGGDGDASVGRGVPGIEGARAVQADPRGARLRRGRGHLGAWRVVGEQAPMDGGARVAQDGARPAREDRREVSPLAGERGAADRVDAAMDAAQAPALRAQLCRARPEPERPQLHQRHDTPLAVSQLGKPRIDARAVFAMHSCRLGSTRGRFAPVAPPRPRSGTLPRCPTD